MPESLIPEMPTSAEQLATWILSRVPSEFTFSGDGLKNAIINAIENAQKEAYLEGHNAYKASEECIKVKKEHYEMGRGQGYEEAKEQVAKFMESYGCTACDHFDHDASPDLIRAMKREDK